MTEVEEARRIIQLIQTMQRILDISNRDLERKLGLSPSYLSRLYNGLIELRLEHLAKLIPAMGLRLDEFFAIAYPRSSRPPSEAARRMKEVFGQFESSEASLPQVKTEADLRELIETAFKNALKEVQKAG